jgi:subtilisin family serine protease
MRKPSWILLFATLFLIIGIMVGHSAIAAEPDSSTSSVATHTVYLPILIRSEDVCESPIAHNETIRYDMSRIEAPTAWDCGLGGQGVRVAVIDTGVDLDHPDLAANLVGGRSFVPGTSSANDDNGHGSHVAGSVAAVANNGGVIGVAPQAKIMPVKVLDYSGSGYYSWFASGIVWATDNGADILNMSLGGTSAHYILNDAVNYAYNRNVLIVAAAGNCGDQYYVFNGCSEQDQPLYPAAYSRVMAVAATNSNDQQASYSNQGTYVEIAAPGSNIYSTHRNGGYDTYSGTSMASPHVAGLAAILLDQNPSHSANQIRSLINASALDLGNAGRDIQFGYGRIDAEQAIIDGRSVLPATNIEDDIQVPAQLVTETEFAPDKVIVGLENGKSFANIVEALGRQADTVTVIAEIPELQVVIVQVPDGDVLNWMETLSLQSGVRYAEPDYIVHIQ